MKISDSGSQNAGHGRSTIFYDDQRFLSAGMQLITAITERIGCKCSIWRNLRRIQDQLIVTVPKGSGVRRQAFGIAQAQAWRKANMRAPDPIDAPPDGVDGLFNAGIRKL